MEQQIWMDALGKGASVIDSCSLCQLIPFAHGLTACSNVLLSHRWYQAKAAAYLA